MGLETDFAHLEARVGEVEQMAIVLARTDRTLTEQVAGIVAEQHLANKHRIAHEARLSRIETEVGAMHARIDTVATLLTQAVDAQTSTVARLDSLKCGMDEAVQMARQIGVAVRWVRRLRTALVWIGAPLTTIALIWWLVAMAMSYAGSGPTPPTLPPLGGIG